MKRIPNWAVKIVSGILESGQQKEKLKDCDNIANSLYTTQEQRNRFIHALQLNIINRKKYSALYLIRIYDLNISEKTFFRYKERYCQSIAKSIELNCENKQKLT